MKLKLTTLMIIIPLLLFSFLYTCSNLPSDKKNTLKGDEVIGRLQKEAKEIDNKYFNTDVKNSLPFKSAHNYQYFGDLIFPVVISINPKLNYEKESVDECVKKIRTIGFPLGGVPALLGCDVREAGLIDLGIVSTKGKSTKKNTLLLNILALP